MQMSCTRLGNKTEKMRTLNELFRPKIVIPCILATLLLYYLFFSGSPKQTMKGRLLHDRTPCPNRLGPDQEADLQKILSYKFPPVVDRFSTDLFAGLPDVIPAMPALVTAFDASHFLEGLQLFENLEPVRKKYPDMQMYFFDLGLHEYQKTKLLSKCNCTIRKFPFEKFPPYVRWLKTYAWKPIAIQLVLKQHPFVFWMDASVRLKTTDLDPLLHKARNHGILATEAQRVMSLAVRTVEGTFNFLQEQPCAFREMNELQGGFIIIHADDFVKKYFLRPWISCALSEGCMVPTDAVSIWGTNKYIDCSMKGEPSYFVCHRFDQSILSILLTRIYHSTGLHRHKINPTIYQFCKASDERWFLPNFLNENIFKKTKHCG